LKIRPQKQIPSNDDDQPDSGGGEELLGEVRHGEVVLEVQNGRLLLVSNVTTEAGRHISVCFVGVHPGID